MNVWDINTDTVNRGYGHLRKDALYTWATEQSELSEQFKSGEIPGTSASLEGRARKSLVMKAVEKALTERSNMTPDEIEARMKETSEHLEDPGLLKNFEFFDIPSSDFMLQFYFAVWDRRIAELMEYLHNYGKDLKGVMRRVPEDDVWFKMSYLEGMNINERKKSFDVASFIRQNGIKTATAFGGGNIPERFYNLPKDLKLTVFDDGPVGALEDIFPDEEQRRNVNYIHERLSEAPKHEELLRTQQLVWMHGVSMYLNEKERHEMAGAILCAAALLQPGGYMKYDYLVWTESIKRVIKTQCWPYDPRNPMVIFNNAAEAIDQGMETLEFVNAQLGGKAFMDALDPKATIIDPWGVQSVRFTVKMHV